MTDEQIALARRAVACRGWRWMPGILTGDGFRCVWSDEVSREWASPTWCENGMSWKNTRTGSKDLPDLTDPATLGCLLALVREAFEDKGVGAICQDVGIMNGSKMWSLIGEAGEFGGYWTKQAYYSTEAEALVAALEAAPCGQ